MLGFGFVGWGVCRVDVDKVLGDAVYAADLVLPGMVYVKLVGAPVAHALIRRVDVSGALRRPGVVAVFTGRDFPFKVGIYAADRDVLARDRVLYYGHPVAAVVAESLEKAERAAEYIKVEYEPLEPVLTIDDALRDDSPRIHPDLENYRHASFINPVPGTNIANYVKLRKGDIEEGFSKADLVVKNTYRQPVVSHAYLEPWTGIAWAKKDGTIEIWSSHQSPFAVRNLLALSLNIPIHKIIVHHLYCGGGFGGKAGLLLEHIPALISMKLGGKPVKLELNREENYHYMAQKAAFKIEMETGATWDGKLVVHRGKYYLDAGAYADYTVNMGRAICFTATGPYEIPNIWIDSYTVYTNKVPTTAFRGFSIQELHFAFEQQIDILAEKLGIDPVELRLKNVFQPGKSLTATREKLRTDAGAPGETIKRVAELIKWGEPPDKPDKPWKLRGKGLAAFWKGPVQPSNAASSAIIKMNEDGSVDVLVGTGEMGQGTITALAQIVAEELGIPIEKIRISPVRSTDTVAYTWQTVGSRGLFTEGQALLKAINDLKEQAKEIASHVLKVNKELLVVKGGKVYVKGEPWKNISLEKLAIGYTYENGTAIGGPLIGRGSYVPAGNTYLDPETGEGKPAPFYTFGAGAVEIEIDLLTMKIRVVKAAIVFDTVVINPELALGQVYGGVLMGTNLALLEEIVFDNKGRLLNPNFTDYRLPRSTDMPKEIMAEFLGYKQEDAPYGAKGIGELAMLPWPAAIANAVYNALGIRVFETPITPSKLLEIIKEQKPSILRELDKILDEVH